MGMRLPRENVVMVLENAREGVVHLRLHLGCREKLPADFMRRYCAESWRERVLRLMSFWAGEGTRHHFRMRVERYDETAYGVFSWRVEDAFRELRKAGFLFYDDNRGDWTPCNDCRHLVEQGRAEGPVPALRYCPGGYIEDVIP